MAVRMQQRKGTAAEWIAANPILAAGEIGFETDTGYFKVGNATSTWTQLEYFKSENDLGIADEIDGAIADLETSLTTYIDTQDATTLASANLYAQGQAATALADANAYTDNAVSTASQNATAYTDGVATTLTTDLQDYTDAEIAAEALARSAEISSAISAEVIARDSAISDAVTLAVQQEASDRDDAIQIAITQEISDRNASIDAAIASEVINRNDAISDAIAISEAETASLIDTELAAERIAITAEIDAAIALEEVNRTAAISDAIVASEAITNESILDAIATAAADATTKANQAESDANAYTETAISTHNTATTNVHGIADTANLATKSYADDAVSTHNSDTTNVHGIADTANLATKTYVDDEIVVHDLTTLNVHGIADTSALETQTGAQNKANAAYANAIAYTDIEVAATETAANAYTDQAELDANAYTDNQVAGALITAQGYANTAESNSNDYADSLAINYEAAGATEAHNLLSTLVHGVTADSDVVGTNMSQTVTNKILGTGTVLGANLDANGKAITNIPTPVQASDAVNKAYVDAVSEGLYIHAAADVATTASIDITADLNAGDVIDGFTLAEGMRVIVKNQTTASQNGIYVVQATGAAVRASDFDTATEIKSGDFVYVSNGNTNGGTSWVQINAVTTVGTDPINFVQFAGQGTTTAGFGLNIFGNEISVNQEVMATREYVNLQISEASVNAENLTGIALNSEITSSNLQNLGTLDDLTVSGATTLNGGMTVTGSTTFNSAVNVPAPTAPTHATTKEYIDSLLSQSFVEIRSLDNLQNFFDGYTQRFLPTYQGVKVPIKHPFNLLVSIDGIIQSVGSPDYVWQSVLPRVGFDIDYEGYIRFPEPIPPGSGFDVRLLVGSEETKQTKVYPFKAEDILLGGY